MLMISCLSITSPLQKHVPPQEPVVLSISPAHTWNQSRSQSHPGRRSLPDLYPARIRTQLDPVRFKISWLSSISSLSSKSLTGSASPVVSNKIYSNFPRRSINCSIARTPLSLKLMINQLISLSFIDCGCGSSLDGAAQTPIPQF